MHTHRQRLAAGFFGIIEYVFSTIIGNNGKAPGAGTGHLEFNIQLPIGSIQVDKLLFDLVVHELAAITTEVEIKEIGFQVHLAFCCRRPFLKVR
ncbi:hypothetical protein [Sphingobacterium sp.]|uniref:hypothetical protein n=1 Tax=Sphingobacterium sp. TaxID=341027 RepID=UPI0031D9601C